MSGVETSVPRFEGSYPEGSCATLTCSLQYEGVAMPASHLRLPDFYLRPGEAILLFLGKDGRVTVKAFGEK